MSVDELRQQLEALQRSHDELLKSITRSNGSFAPDQAQFRRVSTREAIFADSSIPTDDEDEEDESFFVQQELPAQSFDHEHLREHLKKHTWNEHGRQILASLFQERGRLKEPNLFPTRPGPSDDRSHYSHFQVYDIGTNGIAELVESSGPENTMSRAVEIWHQLKDIGATSGNSKVDKPVGRITIAREPSPILFGALHLTMNNAFDMDELFRSLVTTDSCSAHMERAFDDDPRHQKTFYFNFEYYTLIGDDCQPMEWQLAERRLKPGHTPLTRCGAVVALSLYDDKPKRLRTRGRRGQTRDGRVQNIWSPWQVLVIECFPDWRATADTFEHGHRYLNGPEAFLHALLTEYRDARKRYGAIYERITRLVTPPNGFLFDGKLRDQRLFEDRDFSWTRRYFWAHQTLGNVNDTIKTMIDSFEDTFTDDVWEGKSDTIWPLFESSPRNDHWRHRLRMLRTHFEREMKELRILISENNERRHEIRTLQEHLFSGTSIQEVWILFLEYFKCTSLTIFSVKEVCRAHRCDCAAGPQHRKLPCGLVQASANLIPQETSDAHQHDIRPTYFRHECVWHDKYGHNAQLLAVRRCSCHCLCAFLCPHWVSQHGLRIPHLDGQDEAALEMDAPCPEAKDEERCRRPRRFCAWSYPGKPHIHHRRGDEKAVGGDYGETIKRYGERWHGHAPHTTDYRASQR